MAESDTNDSADAGPSPDHAEDYFGTDCENLMADLRTIRDDALAAYEEFAVIIDRARTIEENEGAAQVERTPKGLHVEATVADLALDSAAFKLLAHPLTRSDPIRFTDEGVFKFEAWVEHPGLNAYAEAVEIGGGGGE